MSLSFLAFAGPVWSTNCPIQDDDSHRVYTPPALVYQVYLSKLLYTNFKYQ